MSFVIKITGVDELKRRIDPAIYKPRLLQTMQQISLMIAAYVKSDELSGQVLNIRTGRLKASIQGTAQVVGDLIVGSIGTNVVYARIQELGGTIRAINGPYLKFQVGGQWVQKKEVVIPARPFLEPGIKNNKDRIQSMLQQTVNLLLEGK